jgi:dTDP-4-amino-4,6-dideoxygalactose transaminase
MKDRGPVPFNQPYMTGKELYYIAEAKFGNMLAGDGPFTKRCHHWLEQKTRSVRVLLTHSCTAALEMTALLLDIRPGDEIIMPSFTFVSTANAFVLRGGVPVFVDIRGDTLNIDERLIESAITPRTRAIAVVHYAGVGCEMDTITALARRHGLKVVEDAAQGVMASYKGRALGSIGELGTFSFHETKNIISGEGGALLVNDPALALRAEIIREKGTDRSRFYRGEVDKYTWQEVGSSFLPGELMAAFLWAQLEEAESLTERRLALWNAYHAALEGLERAQKIRRPTVPTDCRHNAHMYYLLVRDGATRSALLAHLKERGVSAIFHYIPLHSSTAGRRYCRPHGALKMTDQVADTIVRLPLWIGMGAAHIERVVGAVEDFFRFRHAKSLGAGQA